MYLRVKESHSFFRKRICHSFQLFILEVRNIIFQHILLDTVEKATGLNFFSRVPKEEQERLERTISVKAWKGL